MGKPLIHTLASRAGDSASSNTPSHETVTLSLTKTKPDRARVLVEARRTRCRGTSLGGDWSHTKPADVTCTESSLQPWKETVDK